MIGMSQNEAAKHVVDHILVTREDIARAKNWLVDKPSGRTDDFLEKWMSEQKVAVPREINIEDASSADVLSGVARAYSLRMAFYQAIWELIAAAELIQAESLTSWCATVGYKTSHGAGGLGLDHIGCSYPLSISPLPSITGWSTDTDVFLKGIDCKSLHSGIHEAMQESLLCFRRGLYMPATAMLAAAAEATWTECGIAVARRLSIAKFETIMADSYTSIAKKVSETRKVLEQSAGRQLLKDSGRTISDIDNAEVWTTVLRDRRNALHWGKAKSFVADHTETGTLLMAAPQHLRTLEAIRVNC
jgi:hypothetical protein